MEGFLRFAYLLAAGHLMGCHAGKAAPQEGSKAGASVRSTPPDAGSSDSSNADASVPSTPPAGLCLEPVERMRVGAVERKVVMLDLEHMGLPGRLHGCVVGIRAARPDFIRECNLGLCEASRRCCNSCSAGSVMFFSSMGAVHPRTDGKSWACKAGMDCDLAKDCDVGPGYYALIGRFSVLEPKSFQLDVEAMEQVPDPNLPGPPRQLEAPCYPDLRVAPLRGWSKHFRVEQGGIVLLIKSEAASEIGQLAVSYGLKSLEMETCDGVLALWMPGVDCPPHGGLMDAIGKIGRVQRTVCFRPMSAEEVKQSCKKGAIPTTRCN